MPPPLPPPVALESEERFASAPTRAPTGPRRPAAPRPSVAAAAAPSRRDGSAGAASPPARLRYGVLHACRLRGQPQHCQSGAASSGSSHCAPLSDRQTPTRGLREPSGTTALLPGAPARGTVAAGQGTTPSPTPDAPRPANHRRLPSWRHGTLGSRRRGWDLPHAIGRSAHLACAISTPPQPAAPPRLSARQTTVPSLAEVG